MNNVSRLLYAVKCFRDTITSVKKSSKQKRRDARERRRSLHLKKASTEAAAPFTESGHKDKAHNNASQPANHNTAAKGRSERRHMSAWVFGISSLICGLLFCVVFGFWFSKGLENVRVGFYWLIPASVFLVIAILSGYWHNVVKPAGRADAVKQTTTLVPLRGLLSPANDPIPEGADKVLPKKAIAVFVGDVMVVSEESSFTLLKIADEETLSFEKTSDGMYINAVMRNDRDEVVARIAKNAFSVDTNKGYYTERPDTHTLLILTPDNRKALYVRYMNPSAMKVLGIFQYKGRTPMVIEEGKPIPNFPLSNMRVTMGRGIDTLIVVP